MRAAYGGLVVGGDRLFGPLHPGRRSPEALGIGLHAFQGGMRAAHGGLVVGRDRLLGPFHPGRRSLEALGIGLRAFQGAVRAAHGGLVVGGDRLLGPLHPSRRLPEALGVGLHALQDGARAAHGGLVVGRDRLFGPLRSIGVISYRAHNFGRRVGNDRPDIRACFLLDLLVLAMMGGLRICRFRFETSEIVPRNDHYRFRRVRLLFAPFSKDQKTAGRGHMLHTRDATLRCEGT